MSGIRLARVVKASPDSVDVVFIDNGDRVPDVQVMSHLASTNSGSSCIVQPDVQPGADQWEAGASNSRDIIAVVAFYKVLPIVLGFIFPQVNEMQFLAKNFSLNRHPSDVYSTIDDAGNVELFHPSGTYLRIGASSAHQDLTGKDIDGRFKVTKNTTTPVHVHLGVANAGASVASIDIDPSGNITLQNNGSLAATVGGNVTGSIAGNATATVGGTFHVTSAGQSTLTAPHVLLDTPDTICVGKLTVQGGMAVSGGTGAAMQIAGDISSTGTISAATDMVAAGRSAIGHHHNEHDGPPTGPALA